MRHQGDDIPIAIIITVITQLLGLRDERSMWKLLGIVSAVASMVRGWGSQHRDRGTDRGMTGKEPPSTEEAVGSRTLKRTVVCMSCRAHGAVRRSAKRTQLRLFFLIPSVPQPPSSRGCFYFVFWFLFSDHQY